MIEAIILAGGLGTRLRSIIANQPKCMAPVNGKPFLFYVINYLEKNGIEKFIFSVGYMHEAIEDYLKNSYRGLNYKISLEDEPLGTGGAIKLACEKSSQQNVLACNGDTLFKINLQKLSAFHTSKNSDCSLCLKPMKNFDRYGVVVTDADNTIKSFKEKQAYEQGCINGGMYALHRNKFLEEELPTKFSFEKDYLEALYDKRRMFGLVQDEYFIDIGIPEDYERAQQELIK